MEIISTPLKDCFIIKVKMFGDDRGFFLESFNKRRFKDHGIDFEVKQINFAKSTKNVLRGLHYQKAPYSQTKLVGVISGAVDDVVVDLRKSSPTFMQSFTLEIASQDTFLLVPKGFAHGYITLKDETVFYYAVDDFYNPEAERGIRYDDPNIGISWDFEELPIISEKDLKQPYFAQAELFE